MVSSSDTSPRARRGAGERSAALVPAAVAVALVGAAAGEARRAAMLDVPCLGSMTEAATLAVFAFAIAVVAMCIALGDIRLRMAGMRTGDSRSARRAAVIVPALGVLCFAPVAAAGLRSYDPPRAVALHGFGGDTTQQPQPGTWTATGTYRFSEGLGQRERGDTITRALVIRRVCATDGCHLTIARQYANPPLPLTARLVQHGDGWHALFPPLRFACSATDAGGPSAPMRSQWVLQAHDGGRTLEARERVFVYERGCQYRNALVEWTATLTAPDPPPAADPPAGAQPAIPV